LSVLAGICLYLIQVIGDRRILEYSYLYQWSYLLLECFSKFSQLQHFDIKYLNFHSFCEFILKGDRLSHKLAYT
jgi:hypothetical protein